MKVLISGYSGFVGSNLLRYMQDKWEVHGLSRNGNGTAGLHAQVSWERLLPDDLQSVDAVIHLAGKAHDVKNASDPAAYFETNTKLSQRLFDLFLESPAKCFIYFSSVKAAADRVSGELTEEVKPDPQTPYGQSKQLAEAYMLGRELPPGKALYIIRPCMIHGPGNKGNLNLLYQFVNKGIPYPLAAFDNKRSFLSVDNLCFVIAQLLEANGSVPSGIYNVADDDSVATNELINIIAGTTGKGIRKWNIPRGMVKGLAKMGDVLRLPLNSSRLQKLTEDYVVSNRKIKQALKIDRLPLATAAGLAQTIRSFQQK
ncbi:NAD-dependent epimerase/dehydratase family protein [Chitinophaga vietnamensis]|uniref:NAD-dependent epimerase/dehydratase family protein n=1 Tax=Chitinophaga vietnamensis TaxID=2593957 RepID=UPI0011776A98|nr:NAD-dependent epimerase/dehydratase family protein [Chitinophaga vietnamensis]